MAPPHVGTDERRARLGVRHRLATAARASSVAEAAGSVVALHATDAASVFLEARAELVRRWLHAFGPGTRDDVRWWTGWTVGATRQALAAAGAVEVDLDDGATGYLLGDDLEPVEPPEPWVALLPALDATTMGWKERDWYLGSHRAQLFDTAGNAGPTVWVDGRIVGG